MKCPRCGAKPERCPCCGELIHPQDQCAPQVPMWPYWGDPFSQPTVQPIPFVPINPIYSLPFINITTFAPEMS